MAKYEIKRWDPVVFGNNINPFPVIYIKPDEKFLEFASENKNTLIVKIDGTNTIYDGKAMIGVLNPSGNMPNCRPNFFDKTKLYTVALYASWYKYPDYNTLGTATFTGLKGEYKAPPVIIPEYTPPVPVQEFYDAVKEPLSSMKNFNNPQIIGITITFSVLIAVLVWLSLIK